MRTVLGIFAGLLLAVSPVWAAALDGKTFSGTIGKMGSQTGQPDDFVFKDGKFASTLCNKFGYKEGIYQPIENSGVTYFTAQCKGGQGWKKSWRGSVKGGHLEGTVTTVEGQSTDEEWFKGDIQSA